MKIRRILLLTDLSQEATRAFGPVAELARRLRARITLLHVVYDVGVDDCVAYAAPHSVPDIGRLVASARQGLEEHRTLLPAEAVEEAVLVGSQDVPRAITEYARAEGFDLIALSSHGRTGFRRLVMGSVAEAVVRRAHTPLLILPRQE